jgi:MFS family permease
MTANVATANERGTTEPQRNATRPFLALLISSFFTIAGNAFTTLAIPLYVLATTGSAARTGVVAFFNTAPPIISAILGGPLIDRIGRRRTMISSDVLSMITLAAIPILDHQGHLTFPLLLGLVALGSVFDPPGSSARQSMLPRLATEAGFSPERAQSLFSVSFGLAQIAGPALAGLSVAAIGAAGTLWINCGTFVITIVLVSTLIHRDPEIPAGHGNTFLDDLRSGWRYVWNDKFLRTMLAVGAAFSALFVPIYTVVYPVYFTRVVHSARGLGFFIAAESLGGLLGAVGYGAIGERFSRYRAMAFCLIAWLPSYWILVFHPRLEILLVAGFLAGLVTGPLQPIFNVAFQVRTPEHMRARIYGIAMASNFVAVPLGGLIMGPLIQVAGIIPAMVILASVVSVMCVWAAFLPVLRELDHPLEQVQTPS